MVNAILSTFPDAHILSGYARVRCPYHKGGHEAKPSMSILLERRGSCPKGFCHCFACGKVTDLNTMLDELGIKTEVTLETTEPTTEKDVRLTTTTVMHKSSLPFLKSNYLEKRGIHEGVQRKFRVYEKDGKVHMPVFTRDGFYLYDNARSVVGKRFFVETGSTKTLWGIEEIDLSKPIAVCESQIDAMSLWEAGVQAVATLGADNIGSLSFLLPCTSTIILAFDPDEAGRRARDRAAAMLGKFRCKYLELPEGIDVNQALQDIQDIGKFKNFMSRCIRDYVQYGTKGENK